MQRPVVERRRVIEQDNVRNAVRPPGTSAIIRSFLENNQKILYRAEAPGLRFVHMSVVKEPKASFPAVSIGTQCKKVIRARSDEERVKIGTKSLANVEGVTDATTAVSGTLQLEPDFAF